jgi:hypothetical protein
MTVSWDVAPFRVISVMNSLLCADDSRIHYILHVLTAVSMMSAFWGIAPLSLVDVD